MYQGILYLQTATDKQQQCSYDVVGLDRRQMSCNMSSVASGGQPNGGLSRLHSADEDAVSWMTNYGKWHAYEKKKTYGQTTKQQSY